MLQEIMSNWLVFPRKHVNRTTIQVNKITNISIFTKNVLEDLKSHKNHSEAESYKILKKHAAHTRTYTETIQKKKKVVSKFK